MKLKITLSVVLGLSAVMSSFAQDASATTPAEASASTASSEPFSTTPITLIIDASKIGNWSDNQTQNWCTTLEARANYKCTDPSQISRIQDSLNRIPIGSLQSPQKAEDLVGAPIWKIRFNTPKTSYSRYLWFPLIAEREFSLDAWVTRPNKAPIQFKKALIDLDGYCGPLNCEPDPLDALEKKELLQKVSGMILDSLISVDSLERNPAPDSTAASETPPAE